MLLPRFFPKLSPGLKLVVIVIGVVTWLIGTIPPAGAVTDCSKPKNKIDWMICSNERAAAQEQRMAIAFRGAMARAQNREQLLQEQKEWTGNVRDVCNDVACLIGAYRARTEELETY